MRINEFDNQLTKNDLDSLETFADKVFGKVGIDVNFTRHFLDRVNDERNRKQISMGELTRLFKQEAKRFAKPIAKLGPDAEAVMKDLQTDINMPFVLVWDERNEELDLIAKTVMRKKNFKTSDPEFTIESYDLSAPRDGKQSVSSWILDHFNRNKGMWHDGSNRPSSREEVLNMLVQSYDKNEFMLAKATEFMDTIEAKYGRKDEELEEESTISTMNKEDPNNPEIHIQGYGVVTLSGLEKSIVRMIKELGTMADQGNFDNINTSINKGLLQTKLQAVIDTKADLQAIRKKGGPKSRGIARESLFDTLIGEDSVRNNNDESPFEKLARKYQVTLYKRAYARAAEVLHAMLQRKHKENNGKWRHALGWYVAKIADGFTNVKSSVLMPYYLENYESAFITESGGVGKVVPGVNTTVDVGPDEIKTQAKKFGNDVDKNGIPKNTHRK
jgi:hypothetical protein